MSSLKRLVVVASMLTFGGQPLLALDENPLDLFAGCAGRLSALMEHQWLFGDARAEITEQQRKSVLELLEATMQPGEESYTLALRISAKQARAVLLTRATFNDDPADAAWAAEQSALHESSCRAFLLG